MLKRKAKMLSNILQAKKSGDIHSSSRDQREIERESEYGIYVQANTRNMKRRDQISQKKQKK